jgi:hypothetical protein
MPSKDGRDPRIYMVRVSRPRIAGGEDRSARHRPDRTDSLSMPGN